MVIKLITLILITLIPITSQADTFNGCMESAVGNLDLDLLQDKIALLRPEAQTFLMKTNSSTPTEQEKKLIVRWIELRDECWKNDVESRNRLPPPLRTLAENGKRITDDLALNLYDGKITYGEFARKREEAVGNVKSMWEEAVRNLQQQQQQGIMEHQRQQANETASAAEASRVECENARRTMESFCNQQAPSMMTSFNCGSWQAKVSMVCR